MSTVKVFTFNPFYENTYVVYDDSKECVIIDPGCRERGEEKQLLDFIEKNNLKPVRLLNTHCHIDHIFGNLLVSEKFKLPLEANVLEESNITRSDVLADQFGLSAPKSPQIEKFLEEVMEVTFGNNTKFKVLFTPGHSPGHVVFHNEAEKYIIGGDVLFRESIGRTDLPGGDTDTLLNAIRSKLFVLDNDITVYSGHGPQTTIGHEKAYNPFLKSEVWE
jgi:glyoxylase-like metal-dependent hydrolase (beta-lactamase superfamily II)